MNCFLIVISLIFMSYSIFIYFYLLYLKSQFDLSLLFVGGNCLLLISNKFFYLLFVLYDILIGFIWLDNFNSFIGGSKYVKYDISYCHFVIISRNVFFVTIIKLIICIFMTNYIIYIYMLYPIFNVIISNFII